MNTENEKVTYPCRYCKQPVSRGDKRCPYCGTLNPTMDAKRALVWTVVSIVVLYMLSWVLGGRD